ncbi:ABC transporter ATP-binding protein [Exiguobacterium acetylicum]|uniref:ABC transporter ATP-binding protein n=1 Tax=Exiguobacterium acetylicum TaxID=41170 RepID=UPI001CA75FC8|nr:ABC transporter ATP-binding protein [Exiguobacterium acetylicum]QZY88533.1 ABC transporter ATP-binding protein [Exiguobacterium acetylicum]
MSFSFECKNISKIFDSGESKMVALNSIDLKFKEGEFVSIIGPSGSGKSTLLSILGTLDTPTSGELLFNGKSLSKLNSRQLSDFRFENVGFIFQQFHLIPTLTALENVLSPLFGRKVEYDKEKRALELLKDVGLSDKINSLPSQLSGGQQQRVAVARALIHHPKWLLADEPTGNLDTETGEVIFTLLTKLNRENSCGVFFVTHDSQLATRANRIITMKDGRVVDASEVPAYV